MEHRPAGFDDADLRAALRVHYGVDARELHHLAVGFGDYHWSAVGADGAHWFVTLSDLTDKPQCGASAPAALDGYRCALRTAAALRAGGLRFVVAPEPVPGPAPGPAPGSAPDAGLVVDLDGRWALALFARVEGTTHEFHSELSPTVRAELLALLARLHTAAPPASTPVHTPDVPDRAVIEDALAGQETSWSGGPYAEPARQAVVTHAGAIRARLAEADALAHRLALADRPVVVTHGEPHPGNLIATPEGPVLIDWDTVGLGAPERDLAVVGGDLSAYTEATGLEPDPHALELYRLRWQLADLGEFLRWFRGPHDDDPDSRTAWEGLLQTVSGLDR